MRDPKDFVSDKLVESLLSYETHNKASVTLHEGKDFSNPEDTSVLCVTNYFPRSLPHAQNALEAPTNQKVLCVCCAMIWFVSFSGVHCTPKIDFACCFFDNEHRNAIGHRGTSMNQFRAMRACFWDAPTEHTGIYCLTDDGVN